MISVLLLITEESTIIKLRSNKFKYSQFHTHLFKSLIDSFYFASFSDDSYIFLQMSIM